MQKAGSFLQKFKSLTPPDDAVRASLSKIISRVLDAPVSKAQIKISNNTAFVSGSSVLKNRIRMSRREILETLFEEHPKLKEQVRDVR